MNYLPFISLLKKELMVFISMLAVLAVVLTLSFVYVKEKEDEKIQSLSYLMQSKNKYRLAKKQEKILHETSKLYQDVINKGFLLKENRLSWIEGIDVLASEYEVPLIKYNISKQILIKDAGMKLDYPEINIYQTKMEIDMRLLHVEDFIKFNDKLGQQTSGFYDISRCELKRLYINFNDIVEYKTNENINVNCTLTWLSIQHKAM